jgi:hypothetical protein
MKRGWMIAVMMMLTLGGSLAAQGKRPNTREGFWWGLGLGWGSASAQCDECDGEQTSGLAGNIRLGATLSPNILLGIETNGWYRSDDGDDRTLGFASLVILIYPSSEGAFYLKAGAGLATYFQETPLGELTASAAGASLGAGYEFRIGPNVSIAPFLNSLISTEAEFELEGVSADTDIQFTLFQLGIAVVWH